MAKIQKSTDSSSLAEVVDRILDKGIVIETIRLEEKSGGKSGDWAAGGTVS